MFPLRFFLKQHGFNPIGWGLGVNKAGLNLKHDPSEISWDFSVPEKYRGEAGVSYLCDLMVKKIESFTNSEQTTVTLVGWSLGGSIAREVARDLPDAVDQVVTLGSPIIGGPKYTRAASYLRQRGLNLDWIEKEVARRNKTPIACKVSAIVSRSDGIVDWSASVDPNDQNTRFIESDVSHLGMAINQSTMQLVLSELAGIEL
ncbi:alpha/beta hydrolase [Marinibactrum halimedae]|nr:alpha/beta hydrolase [Marinibactrum halimedae]MCD9459438.1 alpha/beta hydrolase [Marinibactrum halimedae]